MAPQIAKTTVLLTFGTLKTPLVIFNTPSHCANIGSLLIEGAPMLSLLFVSVFVPQLRAPARFDGLVFRPSKPFANIGASIMVAVRFLIRKVLQNISGMGREHGVWVVLDLIPRRLRPTR